MKYKNYHYSNGTAILRIVNKRRPSKETQNWAGTWVVNELTKDAKWEMPCFPEITWGILNKMEYLGYTEVSNDK